MLVKLIAPPAILMTMRTPLATREDGGVVELAFVYRVVRALTDLN